MIAALAAGVRRAEARSRELLGISEDLQMERASLGAFAYFRDLFPEASTFSVVCGRGANGGDGLALARHALLAGLCPVVCFPAGEPASDSLASCQLARVRASGGRVVDWAELATDPHASRPVVDAVFGTGLARDVDGIWPEVFAWMSARPVLSLDLPSGVDPDTGRPRAFAVRARATATFGRIKAGLLLDPGRDLAGEVRVVDIGIPERCWEGEDAIQVLDGEWARGRLPPRPRDAHKGVAGRLLLLAGSDELMGAAILAASAALRSGAGLVEVVSTRSVSQRLAGVLPEAMAFAGIGDGVDVQDLTRRAERADAVVAGPGLGTGSDARTALERILSRCTGPLVLDADAINLVAAHPSLSDSFRAVARARGAVATPHPKEASRLLGVPVGQLLSNPLEAARALSGRFGAVAVFKTSTPVVAAPDGRLAVGTAGHPGM
ncbi:MAG TPA: NAD(P)H-hydrate dehydratase, partial [Fibrobacteria bacterium]|nr:NAD(P)H-hydrate dehydratase [Fibrobacteria bacterium]